MRPHFFGTLEGPTTDNYIGIADILPEYSQRCVDAHRPKELAVAQRIREPYKEGVIPRKDKIVSRIRG
jgi:hypothetical protein